MREQAMAAAGAEDYWRPGYIKIEEAPDLMDMVSTALATSGFTGPGERWQTTLLIAGSELLFLSNESKNFLIDFFATEEVTLLFVG